MKPLLAHIYEPNRIPWDGTPVYVQPKLNGVRALYQDGHFQSRDEMPWSTKVMEHLARALAGFNPQVILDGELYVHGWPLQRINGAIAINRIEPNEDTVQVQYHVFDRIDFNRTFKSRFESLGFISNFIRPVETHVIYDKATAESWYMEYVRQGYEGMMYRIGDCPYTQPKQRAGFGVVRGFLSDKNNRAWHLLKRKDWQDDEFKCIAIEEGEGKRANAVGAFVCALPTGGTFKVGSGITDVEATHYYQNPPIGRLIKVKYLTLTNNGTPFNPTILAVL